MAAILAEVDYVEDTKKISRTAVVEMMMKRSDTPLFSLIFTSPVILTET